MSSDKFDLDAALSDDSTPAALRQWAKDQAATNKRLADELATFKTERRTATLTGALRDAGVNEKLARFYPADGDVSGEAIAGWLKEHGDVFGVQAQPQAGAVTGGDHNPQVADIAAMQKVQSATPAAGSPTPTIADQAAALDGRKMNTADDRAALDAFQKSLIEMAKQDQTHHALAYR